MDRDHHAATFLSQRASNQRLDVADREQARVESALLALVAASLFGKPCLLLGMPTSLFGERINGRRLRCNAYVYFHPVGERTDVETCERACGSGGGPPFLFRVGVQMLRDYCLNVQRFIALMTSSRAMIPTRFRR